MIILHASASDGRLVFWGETSLEPAGKPAKKAVRRNGEFRVGLSRFALDGDRLAEVLAELGGSKASKDQRQQWIAWLPTSERGALPSSPLLVEEPEELGEVKLSPWKTPALALDERPGRRASARDDGKDDLRARYCRRQDAGLLVERAPLCRRRLWPGNNICRAWSFWPMCGGGLARWEPVLVGQDRIEAERLARSMPHACRALCQDEAEPPQIAAGTVLFPVVNTLVDHLVRTAAPRGGKAATGFMSQHDQWIEAPALGERTSGRRCGRAHGTRRAGAAVAAADRAGGVGAVPALPAAGGAEAGTPARATISGGWDICFKRWTIRVCSSRSSPRGSQAGRKR